MSDDRAGTGEGPDAGSDGKSHDESEQKNNTKTEDLAKLGRKDFDSDEVTD